MLLQIWTHLLSLSEAASQRGRTERLRALAGGSRRFRALLGVGLALAGADAGADEFAASWKGVAAALADQLPVLSVALALLAFHQANQMINRPVEQCHAGHVAAVHTVMRHVHGSTRTRLIVDNSKL